MTNKSRKLAINKNYNCAKLKFETIDKEMAL